MNYMKYIFNLLNSGHKPVLEWYCSHMEMLDEESRFAIADLLALAED